MRSKSKYKELANELYESLEENFNTKDKNDGSYIIAGNIVGSIDEDGVIGVDAYQTLLNSLEIDEDLVKDVIDTVDEKNENKKEYDPRLAPITGYSLQKKAQFNPTKGSLGYFGFTDKK